MMSEKLRVSFDFDGCLEIDTITAYAKELVERGVEVWIVTSRVHELDYLGSNPNKDMYAIMKGIGIPKMHSVFLGQNTDKHQYFQHDEDFVWHLDDAWDDVEKINDKTKVKAISNFGNEVVGEWKTQCEALLKGRDD